MLKKRLWLLIFFVISIALWVASVVLTDGDPIKKYGDPEWFGMFPGLEYSYDMIWWSFSIAGFFMIGTVLFLAWNVIGRKGAISMVVIALLIAFFFEDIGIRTGLVFGPYFHTSIEGFKLGTVPFGVIAGWTMFVFIGWVLANLIIDGSPTPTSHSVPRIILGSVVGALVTTTMDLGFDPFFVANGFWVWFEGGTFAGVPIHNYVGWVALCVLTLIVHGIDFRQHDQESGLETLDGAPTWKRLLTIFSVVEYGFIWVFFTLINVDGYVGLVVFFAMGVPFIVALTKWITWYRAGAKA